MDTFNKEIAALEEQRSHLIESMRRSVDTDECGVKNLVSSFLLTQTQRAECFECIKQVGQKMTLEAMMDRWGGSPGDVPDSLAHLLDEQKDEIQNDKPW